MPSLIRRFAWLLPLALMSSLLWAANRGAASTEMTRAALALRDALDAKQLAKLEFSFGDAYRSDWHFVPRERRGLALADMDLEQRGWLRRLLSTALSQRGLARVDGIIELERLLRELESTPDHPALGRDPERYTVALFGLPSDTEPWAWRYEGHHLSFSFTSIDGRVAVTPFFLGANPARVSSGPTTGKRVLAEEEDAARALVHSLSDEQQKLACPDDEVPGDVLLGPGRKASFQKPAGISAKELDDTQRAALLALIELYASNLQPEFAAASLERAGEEGVDALSFLWLGGTEVGEGHYWRVQGKSFALELDNTQNDANHVHTLWRDFQNDFGEDDLARHYTEEHEGK